MTTLKGRSPNSAYSELLKISNTGAGLDSTLRNIEDGVGNQTGIQLGIGKVAIFGYQFPASGFTAGQVLRINSTNNAFEWHTIAASDISGLAAIIPVTTVAGRTGAITLGVSDVTGAAPLVSPALTGSPTAPTAILGTNTTQIASTAFVQSSVSSLATVASTGSYTDLVNTPIYNFDGGNAATNSLFYQIVSIDGGTH
jgi:hypothetical protein